MENIKIRYTWRRDSDGNIIQRVVDLISLEEKGLILDFSGYRLIARDLFTGKQDIDGKDVYENDILEGERSDSWLGEWVPYCGEVGIIVFPFDRDDFTNLKLTNDIAHS